MKLAVIDIGSNAIRFQVTNILSNKGTDHFKRLEYVRFPLRLGHDVFSKGKIREKNVKRFKKLMQAFAILIELYEVDHYMACATSAMREAANGKDLVKEVKKETKLQINVIDGSEEALLINKAIAQHLEKEAGYLHIDVGGGSTELNIIESGDLIDSKSYQIGSVRRLDHFDSPEIWKEMEQWVTDSSNSQEIRTAVGTGGNINKLFELGGKVKGERMTLVELEAVQNQLIAMSLEERIFDLQLNPDRADVIIPASEIYLSVMRHASIQEIIVPDVGLKDGMIQTMYEKYSREL